MKQFVTLLLIWVALNLYRKILETLIRNLETFEKKEWYKYAFLSRKHLVQLPIADFEEWCCYFLKRQSYSDINIISTWQDNNYKTISCTNDTEQVYVWCKLTKEIDEKVDDYENIDRSELQKFIGTMEHDNVAEGIVITTGDFNKGALEYVENLPKRFTITLYDGASLSKMHRKMREKEVAMLL